MTHSTTTLRHFHRIALGFAAGVLTTFGLSAAAQESMTRESLQRAIVEAVSRGESAEALTARWKAAYGEQGKSVRAPERKEGEALKSALAALQSELQARRAGKGGSDAGLESAIENVRVADALLTASFEDAVKRLSDAKSGMEFDNRLNAARAKVRAPLDALYTLLNAVPPGQDRAAAQAKAVSAVSAGAVTRSLAIVEEASRQIPAPILRASTLPVRPANLPVRSPVVSPVVTPAYLVPNEVAPQPADSAPADEAPFTDEILAKAKDLNYDYVKIFEFVRNSVKTEWYAGSQKAATGVLRSLAGNDVDQASLLIALLRASGAPARYVQGMIELPVETVAAQMGLADAALVVEALTRAGIANQAVVQGGRVAKVRMERVWVAAHVPYTNYRGVVLDATGKTWLPLDASFKRIEGMNPEPALAKLGQSGASLADAYRSADRNNDLLAFVRERLTAALPAGQTYAQVLGEARIQAQNLDILPNTLPYAVVAVTREGAALDPALVVTAKLKLIGKDLSQPGMDATFPLAELVNNRVTLSYDAATTQDHRVSLLWGGIDLTPSYLVKLRAQLHIAGKMRGQSTDELNPGSSARFEIVLTGPFGTHSFDQTLTVGAYHAIGVAAGTMTRADKALVGDNEYKAAELLDGIAKKYVADWKAGEDEFALLTGTAVMRPIPSIVMVNNYIRADAVANVTFASSWRGVTMDAMTRISEPVGAKRLDWMKLSALQGSSLEQRTFATQFQVDSVSADRVLALAGAGVTLNSGNVESQLAALPFDGAVKDDMRSWVRQGYTVTTHANVFTKNIWSGVGWMVEEPATGAAGYFLSGALAGGSSTDADWVLGFLEDALRYAHGNENNNDPLAAASISPVPDSDGQKGTVNEELKKPMAVLVRDDKGAPVQGARVMFRVVRGGSTFGGETNVTVTTNGQGIAQANPRMPHKIRDNYAYMLKEQDDKYPQRASQTVVSASVATRDARIISTTLNAFAMPDKVNELRRVDLDPKTIGGPGRGISVSLRALDKFENPVASVAISANAAPSTNMCKFYEQERDRPTDPAHMANGSTCEGTAVFGECPAAPSYNSHTDTLGYDYVRVLLPMLVGSTFPVTIRGGGKEMPITFESPALSDQCNIPFLDQFYFAADTMVDGAGRPINAAKAGRTVETPVKLRMLYTNAVEARVVPGSSPECMYMSPRYGFANPVHAIVEFTVTNGGTAQPTIQTSPSVWSTYITTGNTPARNDYTLVFNGFFRPGDLGRANNVSGNINTTCMLWQRLDPDHGVYTINDPRWQTMGHVWGVGATVFSVASQGAPEPGRAYVESGVLKYPVQVDYKIEPPEYKALIADIELLVNDKVDLVFPGSSDSGFGNVYLPQGLTLNSESRNELRLVLNSGTKAEIKSDTKLLPFREGLIQSYSRSVVVKSDVDLVNERSCAIGADFNFNLAQSARITLKAVPLNSQGEGAGVEVVLIDNQEYPKGDNSFLITPGMIVANQDGYQLTLRAVAVGDPSLQQIEQAKAKAVHTMHDALPVGHIMVKGVNVKSGRMVLPGLSFEVQGRGPHLAFRPTYSSAGSGKIGVLGANWGHNHEAGISVTPCGDVIVSAGDGGTIRFIPQPNNTLKPAKGYHGTLLHNEADKSFDFYSKDGTKYHFDFHTAVKSWRLMSVTDTNGNKQTLVYDLTSKEGLLKQIVDASGRSISFTYRSEEFKAGEGQVSIIEKVTGPDGLSVTFEYDEDGNLVKAFRESAAKASETYAYAKSAPLAFRNLLTEYSNIKGQVTRYDYSFDPVTLRLSQSGAPPADVTIPDGKVRSVTAADGGKTEFAYVRTGAAGLQTTTVTDPRGGKTTYSLDRYGSALNITTPAGSTAMTWAAHDVLMMSKTDANSVATTYQYDDEGNVTEETVTGNGVSATLRNTWMVQTTPPFMKNRPLTRTDRNGKTTSYGYDGAGNLTSETRPEGVTLSYTYAANGDRLTATDGRGGVSRFAYDGSGNLEKVTDAMGGVVETLHDARGRLISTKDQEGRTTTFTYNTLDQMTEQKNAEGYTKFFRYDVLGNKLAEWDELDRKSSFTYDSMNRLLSMTTPIGTKSMTYDLAGNKVSETNWRGHATAYEYDLANRLVKRTEPLGKVTTFGYDGVGNVKSETDAESRTTSHDYDGLNRRTRTTDAELGVTTMAYDGNGNKLEQVDAENRRTTYEYDGLNRLKKSTADASGVSAVTEYDYDANGNVRSVKDPNGNTTAHEYDALNRKTRTTDALGRVTSFSYDRVGNKLQELNARGKAKQFTYDVMNRVTSEVDEERHETRRQYNAVGDVSHVTAPNGNTTLLGFDFARRLVQTEDTLGFIKRITYDADGNALSEMDANINVVNHTYDELGRRTRTEAPSAAGTRVMTFTYDKVGNLKTETDANSNTVTHTYDNLNRRTLSVDSIGTRSRATYDKVGNVKTETDANGHADAHSYDGLNRRTKSVDPLGTVMEASYDKAGNKTSGKDANGVETITAYDALNRPTTVTRAGVRMVTTEYDEVGNVRFVTDANGNKVGFEYDGRNLKTAENKSLGAITRFALDSMGDVLEVTDPEGRKTKQTYDKRRRLDTVTNGANETTDFTYDANGNKTGVAKPKGNTQVFEYDASNRLTKITTPAGSATVTYDLHGNMVGRKDANNHSTAYVYDARHRRTKTTFADTKFEDQTFDGNGNLESLTDANGITTAYSYDQRNRETKKTYESSVDGLASIETKYDGNGNVTETKETYTGAGALTRVHTRTYDSFNRLESETDPWADKIKHTYDAQGNLKSTTAKGSTTQYGYDELNRRVSVTAVGGAVTTAYDRTNLPTEVRYPNGTVTVTTFDAAMRVKDTTTKKGSLELEKTAYTYDLNGNRKDQTRTVATSGTVAQESENVAYAYDNDDWLTKTVSTRTQGGTSTTQTVDYVLDAAGNRKKETSTSGTATLNYVKDFTYDDRDKITRIDTTGTGTGLNQPGTTVYEYDNNGNLTKRTRGVNQRTFVWNVRDRLIEVKEASLTLGKYRYNAEGMRDEIEGKRRTTWVNGFAYLDKDTATNGLLAKYETQANGRTPSLVTTPSGTDYLHADALGSSTLATGTDGAAKAASHFDAFGNVETQGFTPNKFGYTGHEQDTETGLIYFKARHYDPELGRFISADPYEGEPTIPVSWNSYLYANGNPLIYIDRNGYWSVDEIKEQVTAKAKDLYNKGMAGMEAMSGNDFGTGVKVGIAIETIKGGVAAAELAGDAMLANSGNLDAQLRMAQRGKAIGKAVANYDKTAEATVLHVSDKFSEISDNFKQGRYFRSGVGTGELGTQTIGTAAGGYGAGKGVVALTEKGLEFGRKLMNQRMQASNAQAVAQVESAAASTPPATGARTGASSAESAPMPVVEGQKATAGSKPAEVPGTVAAELSDKWAHLSPSERIALTQKKLEANAYRRLQEREANTPGAHYTERHGAQLDLQSQHDRASFGINPTTGAQQPVPSAATRFFSHRDQLNAIDRAEHIFKVTGDKLLAQQPIEFGHHAGSGFKKGTLEYGVSDSAQVILNSSGKAKTAFPIWDKK
jgi:RHS repeat-associated protein